VALGATIIDFHGWEMPLRYGSIPDEHLKVRLSAGLFDLCHMGRLEVVGPDADAWVGRVITNDYDALKPGDARYTLICNERGTVIEDAIVYRLERGPFLVVNASNRARVVSWMEAARASLDARLIDRTHDLAMVALQGPQAVRILPGVIESLHADWETMKYYSIAAASADGKDALVARTGYTGEDGFEVYIDAAVAPSLWNRILEAGGNRVAPIGLGARDTLRLEAGMPLYGNEIDESVDPFEAGLGFAVKLEKRVPFIGQDALRQRKEKGPARTLRGFRVLGRRVARQGMTVHVDPSRLPAGAASGGGATGAGMEVGRITSGAPSPTLGCPVAMGYLDTGLGEESLAALAVDVRGNREPIRVEPLPFYSRTRKKGK
jgi:aminomethyltransferase